MVGAQGQLGPRTLDQLRRTFGGDVITPADGTYHEARRLWNAVHDRRPAVILRPRSPVEVATAVHFGRDHGLELAVRSGGHSLAAFTGAAGCLVVDLSAMRGVEVDPGRHLARANGGALLGELDVAAQARGLVCPVGVVGHTGVAGLTLGGGVGRLQRQFGLTIDNLAAVELVTADGRFVRASETEEPELFWGLRGAGWNFGIATAFELRLRKFGPNLHRGVLIFPATRIHEVWALVRAYAPTAPDAVALIFGIDRATTDDSYPDEIAGRPIVYLAYNHSGHADSVERDTAALHGGPKPVVSTIGSRPYLDVQTAHDLVFQWGHRSFISGCYADEVRPEALDELVEVVAAAPGAGSFSITALGGAIGRLPDEATAFTGRSATFDLSADAAWEDPALDEANRDWVRRAMAVVEPDATTGRYANEISDAGPAQTRAIYGDEKVARLSALKRTWDPDNVFHVNHNVAPATDAP
jgi:FAD/FMN-containing dehydrogenase